MENQLASYEVEISARVITIQGQIRETAKSLINDLVNASKDIIK